MPKPELAKLQFVALSEDGEEALFFIEADTHEVRVEYEVTEISGYNLEDGEYWLEATRFLTCSIKWDGCSDWFLDPDRKGNCHMHRCGGPIGLEHMWQLQATLMAMTPLLLVSTNADCHIDMPPPRFEIPFLQLRSTVEVPKPLDHIQLNLVTMPPAEFHKRTF